MRQMLDEFASDLGNSLTNQPEIAAEIHQTLAEAYGVLGMREPKLNHSEQALRWRRQVYGSTHLKVAESLLSYAEAASRSKGNLFAAEIAAQAVSIYRALAPGSAQLGSALRSEAYLLQYQGRIEQAAEMLREAHQIATALGTNGYPLLRQVCHNQAANAAIRGELDEAEIWSRGGLLLARGAGGDDSLVAANHIRALGRDRVRNGDPIGAELLLREALSLYWLCHLPDVAITCRL